MSDQHTPGPWRVEPRHAEGLFITASDQFRSVVCQVRDYNGYERAESDANALFIVTACNSHHELLAALKGFVYYFKPELTRDVTKHECQVKVLDAARAAIAKAEPSASGARLDAVLTEET